LRLQHQQLQQIIGRLQAPWPKKSMHKKCKLIWGLGLFLRQLIRTRGSAFSSGSGSGFDFAICAVARRGIPITSPTRG